MDEGEDEEGTHEWLNPSLVTPRRRQHAHTFLSFSLQKRIEGMQESGVRGGKVKGEREIAFLGLRVGERELRCGEWRQARYQRDSQGEWESLWLNHQPSP